MTRKVINKWAKHSPKHKGKKKNKSKEEEVVKMKTEIHKVEKKYR